MKGVGICSLFNENNNKAKYFFKKAVRTYIAYQLFPYPIDQIVRTSPYIDPSSFIKLEDNGNFEKFLEEIKPLILNDSFYIINMFDFNVIFL